MNWWLEIRDRLITNDPSLTEVDLHRRLSLWYYHIPTRTLQKGVLMPLVQALQHRHSHLTTLSLTIHYLTLDTARCLASGLANRVSLQHLHLKDAASNDELHESVWRILLLDGVAQCPRRDGRCLQTLGLAACTKYGDVHLLVQILPFIEHLELNCDVIHQYRDDFYNHDPESDDTRILGRGFQEQQPSESSFQSLTCLCDNESAYVVQWFVHCLHHATHGFRLAELTLRKSRETTSFAHLLMQPPFQILMAGPYPPHKLTLQAQQLTPQEMEILGNCLLMTTTTTTTTTACASAVASDSENAAATTISLETATTAPTCCHALNLSHCRRLGAIETAESSSTCDGLQYLSPVLHHQHSKLSHLLLADTAMGNAGLQLLLLHPTNYEDEEKEETDTKIPPSSTTSLYTTAPPLYAGSSLNYSITSLHTLDLTRCEIDDVSPLESVLVSSLRLKILNLNGNRITDDGAQKLSILLQQRRGRQHCQSQEHHHDNTFIECNKQGDGDDGIVLSLSWNRIAAPGAVALVTAPCWTALNLSSNNNVGYVGLQLVANALVQQPRQQQQQRLDLSHTVKLRNGSGGGFRLNPATTASTNAATTGTAPTKEDKERQRAKNGACQSLLLAMLHSYHLVEFQVEGCELEQVDEQIQFYTKWNRNGRYLLTLCHDHNGNEEPAIPVPSTPSTKTPNSTTATIQDHDHFHQQHGQHHRRRHFPSAPLGLWSLVLAKVDDNKDPSLVFSFLREQPHLIPGS